MARKSGADLVRYEAEDIAFPASSSDVPDERSTALVILGPDAEWSKEPNSPAMKMAQMILDSRGNTPRLYKNALVFLAAERARLEELEQAVRNFLAWESILADAEGERPTLNLDNFQRTQATAQRKTADQTVQSRIAETFQTILAPTQENPQAQISWSASRATGNEALALRAWKKLKNEGALVAGFAGSVLRLDLDRVPLWRGDSVSVRQLADDYASYPYLQRLRDPSTLARAIEDGVASTTWSQDGFAYADAWDEAGQRYRGLRCAQQVAVTEDSEGLLIKPEPALRQANAESVSATSQGGGTTPLPGTGVTKKPDVVPPPTPKSRRFHGTIHLDPTRVGRDASRMAEEVIAHLVGQPGAEVTVTIEIEAKIPDGATDQVVRTVTENARTLKFESQGFEAE